MNVVYSGCKYKVNNLYIITKTLKIMKKVLNYFRVINWMISFFAMILFCESIPW